MRKPYSLLNMTPPSPNQRAVRTRSPDLIATIRDCYAELRPSEQAVADTVLADLKGIIAASNGEIALRAGVSEPSVTRFCRAIGCGGVRDFKLQLAQSLAVGEAFLTNDMPDPGSGTSMPPFWVSILGEAHAALYEVERQLDPEAVGRAAEALAKAKRVVCCGFGGSSIAMAQEAEMRFFRYGLSVSSCCDNELARMVAATLRPGDCLLLISATGRRSGTVEVLNIARRYGVTTMAITSPGTAVADAADIALTVKVVEYRDVLTPTSSRFAFLAILDLLATSTGYRLGASARETLRRIKFNILDEMSGTGIEPLGD